MLVCSKLDINPLYSSKIFKLCWRNRFFFLLYICSYQSFLGLATNSRTCFITCSPCNGILREAILKMSIYSSHSTVTFSERFSMPPQWPVAMVLNSHVELIGTASWSQPSRNPEEATIFDRVVTESLCRDGVDMAILLYIEVNSQKLAFQTSVHKIENKRRVAACFFPAIMKSMGEAWLYIYIPIQK